MSESSKRPVNPFKPTAGKTPPLLVGRDLIRQDFADGLEYGPGSPGRLMRITGTRGSGKTVMLTDLGNIARERGWLVVDETASDGLCARLVAKLAPESHLEELSVKPTAFGVSLGELKLGKDHLPLTVREAFDKRLDKLGKNRGLLVTVDEIQAARREELVAIATAFQHLVREDRNVAFVFAGLPEAVSDLLDDKVLTFLRRAQAEELQPVASNDVSWALRKSMEASGMRIDDALVEQAAQATKGYPYMIQLVGYHVWQQALRRMGDAGPIEEADVSQGIDRAIKELGIDVIEPALRGLSPMSLAFLLAMAEDDGPSTVAGIAGRLGKDASYVNTYRTRLIDARIIESAGWGLVDLAIPYTRVYLRENRNRIAMRAGLA